MSSHCFFYHLFFVNKCGYINNKTIITFGYLPYEILESSDDLTAELRTLRNLNIKNDLIPKGDNQYLFKINAPIQMKKIKTMITLINEHFQNTMFKNNANNITIYFFYTSLERNFHDVEFFKDKCIKYIISKNKILFQEYCDNGTLDETNTLQNQDFETPFCLKNETKYMNCIQTNELTHSDVFEYPKTFSNILHNFIATIFCGTQATNKISFS